MLRKISTLFASMAVIALCALPASASPSAAHAVAHKFTVPTIRNHNVVTGWGTYTKVSSARVVVTICARETGRAFAVGAVAVGSKANGRSTNIAAVIIQGHPGSVNCAHKVFLFYTAHLRVHTFIGAGGKIIATSPVKKLY